jgi:hypothetical protein
MLSQEMKGSQLIYGGGGSGCDGVSININSAAKSTIDDDRQQRGVVVRTTSCTEHRSGGGVGTEGADCDDGHSGIVGELTSPGVSDEDAKVRGGDAGDEIDESEFNQTHVNTAGDTGNDGNDCNDGNDGDSGDNAKFLALLYEEIDLRSVPELLVTACPFR